MHRQGAREQGWTVDDSSLTVLSTPHAAATGRTRVATLILDAPLQRKQLTMELISR